MNKQLEEMNTALAKRRNFRATGRGNGAYFSAQRDRNPQRTEQSFAQPASYQRLGTAGVVPTTGPRGSAPVAPTAFAAPIYVEAATSNMNVAANVSTTDSMTDSIT